MIKEAWDGKLIHIDFLKVCGLATFVVKKIGARLDHLMLRSSHNTHKHTQSSNTDPSIYLLAFFCGNQDLHSNVVS